MMDAEFPNLAAEGFQETSPADLRYNCIAWSAGHDDLWWWPDASFVAYWPESAPRVESLEAFISAFSTLGYQPCADGSFDALFEKVAIYLRNGRPTHAARQLADGTWTSKLGQWIDVSHTLSGLEGPEYGQVATFLTRPRLSVPSA